MYYDGNVFVAAIIFVVDSNNQERMNESHVELVKLMTEKRLSDALLLVYANKQVTCLVYLTKF